jgi:chitinase
VSAPAAAPRRRLSVSRLFVALGVVAALVAGVVFALNWVQSSAAAAAKPWFAGYTDVTATPTFAFETPKGDAGRNVVLSFIVSSTKDACTPSWGAAYTVDQAAAQLDLDRRIARLKQGGGDVAVSFGGQRNDELALRCTDTDQLVAAYAAVVDHYDLSTIDLDIEGASLADATAGERRAQAIARLQDTRRAAGKPLAVWLTLPVAPDGLAPEGQKVVQQMLADKVDIAGVNAMTMDFGQSLKKGTSLADGAESALVQVQRQLGVMYRQEGTTLSDPTLWSKIGMTPMIGQNDVQDEVLGLDAAKKLNAFATSHGVGRVSMWSLNRDVTCGANYVTLKVVSDSCSGIDQNGLRFADALGKGLTGELAFAAGKVTTEEPVDARDLTDDPAKSPYQIWTPDGAYLQGTKIVWHHNVYEAKWWTRGDLPDDPVLNAWQTPWTLVGPVLPGETPIPQPTLPAGTYPEWKGTDQYDKGDRVLFEGVPFEAKWWTQGDSPAAASSDPDSSPWTPLTEKQIQETLNRATSTGATPAS